MRRIEIISNDMIIDTIYKMNKSREKFYEDALCAVEKIRIHYNNLEIIEKE